MADVRSLLRSELAARKGSPSQPGRAPNRVTKKRKVDSGEDLTRKKLRQTNATADQLLANAHTIQPPSAQALDEDATVEPSEQDAAGPDLPPDLEIEDDTEDLSAQPSETPAVAPNEPTEKPQTIDEDEWAAFERDVVAPTRVPQGPAALAAAASISAAPVTTEQLAAQQEKDNANLARSREAEAEGEREDAARFLEDEFDEMDQLEERVRRLKQMREELRQKKSTEEIQMTEPTLSGEPQEGSSKNENSEEEEDEDDDEDDDDWDNWRFR